jgi:hypothetical protein
MWAPESVFQRQPGRLRRTSNSLLQAASTLPEPTGRPTSVSHPQSKRLRESTREGSVRQTHLVHR